MKEAGEVEKRRKKAEAEKLDAEQRNASWKFEEEKRKAEKSVKDKQEGARYGSASERDEPGEGRQREPLPQPPEPSASSSSRGTTPGLTGKAAGPKPPSRPPPGALIVSGGWDEGMAETLGGTFVPAGMNHNRAVYRRVEPQSQARVQLYYWDDRDGEEERGWWFGPEVGGEEVWAHNAGDTQQLLASPQRLACAPQQRN